MPGAPATHKGRAIAPPPPASSESLAGLVERVTYQSPEDGFCVLRLKVRRDQVLGTQRAIDAIDELFEASGGRALANGTYLQRAWRDAHAGRVHAANDPERALQMYGMAEFGHKVDPGMY